MNGYVLYFPCTPHRTIRDYTVIVMSTPTITYPKGREKFPYDPPTHQLLWEIV